MKPTIPMFPLAALAAALAAPMGAAAQSATAPQTTILLQPASGPLVLRFTEIDKNGDSQISLVEWNEFVQKLERDRSASAGASSASGGATQQRPMTEKPAPDKR